MNDSRTPLMDALVKDMAEFWENIDYMVFSEEEDRLAKLIIEMYQDNSLFDSDSGI